MATSLSLLGLRTTIYAAPDLARTTDWYTELLGFPPYFNEPFYVGFNVRGYELGLDPNATPVAGTPVTYWGVADLATAWQQLLDLGGTALEEPHEVGGDIHVATATDPFGNVLGLIQNPHFRAE